NEASFMMRPSARGKFLFAGSEKLWVRGISYGRRAVSDRDRALEPQHVVRGDFAELAARGLNAVRVHATPPRWLLDLAEAAGLRVLVGLSWPPRECLLCEPRRPRARGP